MKREKKKPQGKTARERRKSSGRREKRDTKATDEGFPSFPSHSCLLLPISILNHTKIPQS